MQTIFSWIVCFVVPSVLHAAAVRIPNQSASATGQSEAFAAQADDASAIYYNPAGLTQIEGTELMAGGYVWLPSIQFDGAGTGAEMNTPAFIPHFYAASKFGLDDWAFGLGVNNVFGTSVDWGGSFRYLVTEARLTVLNIAPTVAYQISEDLSFGVSLNVYHADAHLKRDVSFAPAPLPDGEFDFKGDNQGIGATMGLLWRITPQHAVGVVYRSPFEVDLDGDSELRHSVVGTGPSSTQARLSFPQIVSAGYAFRPIEKLKLEADIEWTNWDVANKVRFRSSNPAFNGTTIPLRWEDSFTYKFGVEYKPVEQWAVRGGYAFWENSVPDSTFSPLVPDSDYHSLTVGLGYSAKHWGVDLAYQYNLWEDRKVTGGVNSPAVDGHWSAQSQVVVVTMTVKF
jgi:long-chain fatty acid transport protein